MILKHLFPNSAEIIWTAFGRSRNRFVLEVEYGDYVLSNAEQKRLRYPTDEELDEFYDLIPKPSGREREFFAFSNSADGLKSIGYSRRMS